MLNVQCLKRNMILFEHGKNSVLVNSLGLKLSHHAHLAFWLDDHGNESQLQSGGEGLLCKTFFPWLLAQWLSGSGILGENHFYITFDIILISFTRFVSANTSGLALKI